MCYQDDLMHASSVKCSNYLDVNFPLEKKFLFKPYFCQSSCITFTLIDSKDDTVSYYKRKILIITITNVTIQTELVM